MKTEQTKFAENEVKTMNGKYMCLKVYADDYNEYGIDFYSGKIYEYKNGYMHSTENGTYVGISEEELIQYWVKVE